MISTDQKIDLLSSLENRFNKNMHRHLTLNWETILDKISNNTVLNTIYLMEQTGGCPDVTLLDDKIVYVDFSEESPEKRRSLCYDKEALDKRKQNKPTSDVQTEAHKIGITLLNEKQYKHLQTIEPLDLKTSSWIQTPTNIRNLGGALFCDRRYDTVFVYHNGADSYYSSRGFRGYIEI
ncbi:MAG: DUF4256 domain-containing protein [Candidatus Phytoplasma sp.]|nr:DUF4256 domain-containing protein [Phytoplasma sp.]